MIRVLQLRERECDFETERASDALLRGAGEGFAVTRRTIGRGGSFRDVAHGAMLLRRDVASHDLVHAYGGHALTIAAIGTQCPVVFSPAPETKLGTIRWLRVVMDYRRVEVICPTTTLRRALVQRGVPFERSHLIRPGVEFARVRRRRDDALRGTLGFGPGDCVLLAAGESTRNACHTDTAWAASILWASDPKFKLLTWGRGEQGRLIGRFGRKLILSPPAVAEQRLGRRIEFEELLPATDAVLVTARGAVATLPIAICMAAALPIVSTVTPTVAELLEDRHTALMCPSVPRQVARRVLDLLEDSSLQWSISDRARAEAYDYFAQSRFLNQFRTLYRQAVSNDKVEVPEPARGPAARFHAPA